MAKPLRSLATRINLLIFIATLASSIAVTWISLQSLDTFFRAKVDQRFPEIAERISGELDHWFTLRAREIEVFSESAILVDSLPRLGRSDRRGERARDEAEQYLRYVLENFPHLERLMLSDADGKTLLEVGGDAPLPDDVMISSGETREATTIREVYHLGERDVQLVSTPIEGPRAKIGQLHALIELNALVPILSSHDLGEEARIFLIDRDERYLNAPQGIPHDARYVGPAARYRNERSVATVHFDERRALRLVSTRTEFPRFEWSLVVEQPYDEAFAPVVASMTRVIALNAAIVFVCGLAAMRIARSIVRPLGSLAEAARRLSEGERDVEIEESDSSEEIDLLTRTFNEMTRALGRNARELEEKQLAIEAANEQLLAKNEELCSVNLVLEQLSITDGLTKLHNHRYFQDAIAKACKRSARTNEELALVLIDIDFFKRWNDALGHAGGDEILRRIAELLNESVRETDVLARYGGEEFAVLATDTGLEGAQALAEKIRAEVAASNFIDGRPDDLEMLSVSIGVAVFEGDRRKFFVDADEALYRAKNAGRNCVMVAGGDEAEGEPS